MIAVHKLCSTKLNSDKLPSQIYMYSWSAVLSSVIFYIVHVYTYIITTAYFTGIVSMHACHNLRLSSQDTVFQLWYNLSCTQWLEWCLGIFIVIANVSLLSSFQLTSPPDKLFKDTFLNTFSFSSFPLKEILLSCLFLF